MSGYSATMLVKTLSNKLTCACGSFGNINIDGRLSLDNAKEIARKCFKNEASFKNSEYLGFIIEKTNRQSDYVAPLVVDSHLKFSDLL